MAFLTEPCPFCKSANVKLFRHEPRTMCYVMCQDCQSQLIMYGNVMDCARTWNVRAARKNEMAIVDMNDVTLLHSDLCNPYESSSVKISLGNNENYWNIVLRAYDAWGTPAPLRPDEELIEVDYEPIWQYVNALVTEQRQA